ncbi:MAG: RNA ligase [Myxococcales bacterium]|nr:RNA ligase [Myxococcales bacterium]
MASEHIPYDRIPEGTDAWIGDPAALRRLDRLRWAVTEKIHGANFCLVVDEDGVQAAKRKALLGEGDAFFNFQEVRLRHAASALALHDELRAGDPAIVRTFVYGELFGGAYPHPDVAPVAGAQPVQTGVYYAPGVEFCVFDVAVAVVGERRFLDFDEAIARARGQGFFVAEPLHVGSLREALDFPLGFDSTIPARLGLPPLARPNAAEGVVIRPLPAITLGEGAARSRPLLKRKIAAFAEDRRFHGASAWASPPIGAGPLALLEWTVDALLSEQRLESAISKVGRPAPGDLEAMIEIEALVIDDLREHLERLEAAALARLAPAERERLGAAIRGGAAALVLGRFGG